MSDVRNPLVSVCIPVYNNERYIVQTLESIVNQTFKNLEIIIVDDNSSDKSFELIMEASNRMLLDGKVDEVKDLSQVNVVYSKNAYASVPQIDFETSGIPQLIGEYGKRVLIFRNEVNLGMSGNWNRCLELCRGEYIKLICADDKIHSTLIEKEVDIMDKFPEAVLVESDTVFVDNNNKVCGSYPRYGRGLVEGKKIAKHSLFTRDYFGAPLANLIRTSAYKKYGGFDPAFNYIIDYDFFIKLACNGKVFVIREPLNYFCIRDDSNTGEVLGGDKGKVYTEEHKRLLDKYSIELGLSDLEKWMSVLVRKTMNVLGGIYLKIKIGH